MNDTNPRSASISSPVTGNMPISGWQSSLYFGAILSKDGDGWFLKI